MFFDIFFRKLWTLFGVNLLYFIFFLPLVLGFLALSFMKNYDLLLWVLGACVVVFAIFFGPATAGLTKIMRCFVLEKHTFIVRDFFKAFKENFKPALAVGIIDVLVLLSVFAACSLFIRLLSFLSLPASSVSRKRIHKEKDRTERTRNIRMPRTVFCPDPVRYAPNILFTKSLPAR